MIAPVSLPLLSGPTLGTATLETTGSKLSEIPSVVRMMTSPGSTCVSDSVKLDSSGRSPSTVPRAPPVSRRSRSE